VHGKFAYFHGRGEYAPNAPCVGMPLLISQLKSTIQSITCAEVSQSIDND